jgi:peptidoglycan biosynthesis protein MviN/MurJ (putative lipid II flippase)
VVLLSRHALLFIAAGVVAFVFVFAPWLQQVLYYTTDAYNNTLMRLCLLALPAYYLIHVYGSALTATANFFLFITVMLVAASLNILLNLWLIPLYGALGCCYAALITQYGCALLLWITASRKLMISLSAATALFYPGTVVFLGLCFYFGQKLTQHVWIILTSIVLLAIIVVAAQRNRLRKVFLSLYK